MNKKEQAKIIYDHNKKYVCDNVETLTWRECSKFRRKQDALYLIYNSLKG